MFENVDGRTTDGRTTDAGVTGILIAHLGAFGSGELKSHLELQREIILEARARGYKSVFMLNSTEHEIITACRN